MKARVVLNFVQWKEKEINLYYSGNKLKYQFEAFLKKKTRNCLTYQEMEKNKKPSAEFDFFVRNDSFESCTSENKDKIQRFDWK